MKAYFRTSPRTAVSLPFWLAVPFYLIWFAAAVMFWAVVGAGMLAVLLYGLARKGWRSRRSRAAVIVCAVAALAVAAAPAQAASTPAGRALGRPSAAWRVEQVRRVWIWADYWACTFAQTGGPPVPECGWIPSHYALIPDSWVCQGEYLTGTAYRVTVCAPRWR